MYLPLHPRSLLLPLLLTLLAFGAGCDGVMPTGPEAPSEEAAATPGDTLPPTRFQPFEGDSPSGGASGVGVALLAQGAQSRYGCLINTADTSAAQGYSAWNLALAFPEAVVRGAPGRAIELRFRMRLAAELSAGAGGPVVTRARCRVPRSEEALQRMARRIEEGLQKRFGEGYRIGDRPTGSGEVSGGNVTGSALQARLMDGGDDFIPGVTPPRVAPARRPSGSRRTAWPPAA